MEAKFKDKYGNDYVVGIDFDTKGLSADEYKEIYPTINMFITLTHNDKVIEKYHTNAASGVLMANKERWGKELDVERRVNRYGDKLQGKGTVEITINYKEHFNNMMQALVDDFIDKFDNLTLEQRKELINNAMDDIEQSEDHSVVGLMGKVFESCTKIDDFLALDSTGSLRDIMKESLVNAYQQGQIRLDGLLRNEAIQDEMEYDR